MKTKYQLLLALVLWIMIFHQVDAQDKPVYKVSGKVVDASTSETVPYAAAALMNAETKQNVAGAVADMDGEFVITGFKDGSYVLQVSFMGFEAYTSSVFTISASNSNVKLGEVKLEQEAMGLEEVTVQGQRQLIEEKVDRTIYNAENDRTTAGGDASDVLRRVPMLSVDLDGNVSMRGSSNILVLIDGKQSAIVASNISDALKQIPAEEIKSVEVITSPSAKYDAEGTGGVLNIITKKNNLQGASLNVNTSAGLRGSNLGLNASLKRGKMGWTLGGFGRAGYNILGSFENTQTLIASDGTTSLVQQQADTRNNMLFGRYNLGWDYEISKKDFLTASASIGLRNMRNRQDGLFTETFQDDQLISALLSDVNTDNLSNTVDVNFNYTRTFDIPQKEFSISGLYSRNNNTNDFINSLYNGTFTDIISRVKNENLGVNEEYTIQLDYVTPVGNSKNQILEYGAKNILRRVTSDFAYFTATGTDGPFEKIEDATFSNQFTYDQNVTAAYASYTLGLGNDYTLKGGLRYEYTVIEADFRDSDLPAEIPSYGVFVPSFNFGKKLSNGNMIKAAYNRRIQRPSLQFLNPNLNQANPRQQSQGNPLLDPELTDNYELGYSTFIGGSSLNFSSYFRNTTGSIQPIRNVIEEDVIFTTFENIGRERAVGLSIFTNISVSGKFSLNGSIDTYYSMLTNGLNDPRNAASNEGFVVSGRLFGNYTLPKDWQIQGFTFVRGRQVQLQGSAGGFGMYGMSINKQFNEKRGTIGFGADNFFTPEFRINNELVTPTIIQQSVVGMRNMNFKVNFSYRIGKLSVDGGRRRKRGVTNDDMKEGGEGAAGAMMNNN
ncbi:TonB-dependent receptor domain-containing protein [Belliella kenyensis]|uniref:TonB-dependent receptor domain-containing protein n=1 Tax=Belliella kenyensis TaxID=1472724 RepID=A0ABV8EQ21_9BACT|nr:TonB-dependent receptor [Belliella kenyensis]MCH7403587.1 TonB-dependent receptor [Belliella kenyensis]MDN3603861.1 TonB-dependent receptor [Belliella kenyensis]